MAANGGLITREDLARYQVLVEPALTGRYRDVDLAFSPGPTGGATALEILNILGEFPSAKVGWQTVEGLHLRASAIAARLPRSLRAPGRSHHGQGAVRAPAVEGLRP